MRVFNVFFLGHSTGRLDDGGDESEAKIMISWNCMGFTHIREDMDLVESSK